MTDVQHAAAAVRTLIEPNRSGQQRLTAGNRANAGLPDESMVSMADDLDRFATIWSPRMRELRAELDRLRGLLGLDVRSASGHEQSWEPTLFSEAARGADVDHTSTVSDKLALFRSLFGGRTDVYAHRWEESVDCQVWVVADSPRRLVIGEQAQQGVSAVDR